MCYYHIRASLKISVIAYRQERRAVIQEGGVHLRPAEHARGEGQAAQRAGRAGGRRLGHTVRAQRAQRADLALSRVSSCIFYYVIIHITCYKSIYTAMFRFILLLLHIIVGYVQQWSIE